MKNRIFAILLAMLMVVSMLPVSAFAAEESLEDRIADVVAKVEEDIETLVTKAEQIAVLVPEYYDEAYAFGYAYAQANGYVDVAVEGIEIAKAEGKYKGRKPVAVDEATFRAVCTRWRAGEIAATTAMQEVGLKANTFYRRVKELKL